MNSKLVDTFKVTADRIAFLNRSKGLSSPDVQSAIEEINNRIVERDSEIISLHDFGVSVNNSPEDNRDAFHEAFTYKGDTFKRFYLPPGIYESHPIIFPDNLELFGAGENSTIKHILDPNIDFDDPIYQQNPETSFGPAVGIIHFPFVVGKRFTNIILRSFVVDGNNVVYDGISDKNTEGISIESAQAALIENVLVRNVHADGIDIDFSENVIVRNCRFENCIASGVKLSHGVYNSVIEYCYALNSGFGNRAGISDAVTNYGGGMNRFIGNISEQTGEEAMRGFYISGPNCLAIGNRTINCETKDVIQPGTISVGNEFNI